MKLLLAIIIVSVLCLSHVPSAKAGWCETICQGSVCDTLCWDFDDLNK